MAKALSISRTIQPDIRFINESAWKKYLRNSAHKLNFLTKKNTLKMLSYS